MKNDMNNTDKPTRLRRQKDCARWQVKGLKKRNKELLSAINTWNMAKIAANSCSNLMLSSRKTKRAIQIMNELLLAEDRLHKLAT